MTNNTIERLEYHEETFPRIALQNAINEKEAITPYLLDTIRESTLGIERLYHDSKYMLHFYALYLLSQFREEKAFPLIVDFFSTDSEMLDAILDDFITEGASRVLASTYDGNLSLLKGLVENKAVNEYVRSGAKDAMVILYLENQLTREEVIEYFRLLFTQQTFGDNDFLNSSLVCLCADLSTKELKPEIEAAFEADLIDPMFIELEDVHSSLNIAQDKAFKILKTNHHYTLIDDTIGELATWASFQEEPETKNITKGKQKIGRNDPCPCGSGKKFKKCCIKSGIY